jgi:serine/threonine-protein kinase
MYEAVSGRRAFPGEDALAVAARITGDEPQKFAQQCGLDRSVDMVFAKVLSKTPKHRFKSSADFGAALSDALLGSREQPTGTDVARPLMPTLPDQFHLERRARPTFLWTALVALLSAGVTLGLSTALDPVSMAASQAPQTAAQQPREENPSPVAWLAPSPDDSLSDSTPAAPRGAPAALPGKSATSANPVPRDASPPRPQQPLQAAAASSR